METFKENYNSLSDRGKNKSTSAGILASLAHGSCSFLIYFLAWTWL